MTPQYIDVHSHLQFPQYDRDRDAVLARMRDAGVWAITVGVDRESSEKAVSLAREYKGLFATVGLHPNNSDEESFDEKAFAELVTDEKVVAIGECGLDYYRITNQELGIKEVKKKQEEMFMRQIEFARTHEKPLMLHCRPSKGTMDAYEDIIRILTSNFQLPTSKLCGNVHFFVGNTEIAKRFLELGFTLSFTGVITFARDYDEVIRYAPLEMILSETDAPYVAPEPHRGKRNEPTYVAGVAETLAAVRGEDVDNVRESLVQNAKRVFRIGA